MTHQDQIKSLIEPYIGEETKVLPKFLHWILSDPKYGSINHTNNKKSIKAIQGVIDLYETWINTGIKPSKELWLKAKEDAWAANAAYADAANAANAAAAAAAANAADNAASAASAASAWAAAYAASTSIPRSEVEKAQIDKLESLIKTKGEDEDDGLYSWEDYESSEQIETIENISTKPIINSIFGNIMKRFKI